MRALYIERRVCDALLDPDTLSSGGTVFRNGGWSNGEQAVPFVEVDEEIKQRLRATDHSRKEGQLAAAAPDLLVACINLLAEFDRYDAEMTKIGRGHEDYGQQRAAARAAIAKAAGIPEHLDVYEHDDCPKCGTPSVPGEGVPDQALRGCPKCEETWFEDVELAPRKGAWKPDDE